MSPNRPRSPRPPSVPTIPVRMYLREMGAVELLSREGEIAIAKRIEAGRDTMILGLCESPITFHAIIQWSDALNKEEMQLREILDLDAMLSKEPPAENMEEGAEGEDDGEISEATAGPSCKEEEDVEEAEEEVDEDDEDGESRPRRREEDEEEDNTLSLAQMEAQLKPTALEKFANITQLFKKFEKLQAERVDAQGRGEEFAAAKEKKYEKLREELTAEVESVQFHATKIEYLVDNLYAFNRRLTALGGQMLRLAERHKVKRGDFLEEYVGHELDEAWLATMAKRDKKWAVFVENGSRSGRAHPRRDRRHRRPDRHGARRVPPDRQHGPEGRARGAHRQEGNGRGQSPPRDLDRQEIHQPRAAVPRPDPGRQHRADEGGRQVRVSPRLQVQHLCDLVDPPGDHPLDRRPGPHDPYPGPHDRDDQQAGPHFTASSSTSRAASPRPRKWPSASACRSRRSAR